MSGGQRLHATWACSSLPRGERVVHERREKRTLDTERQRAGGGSHGSLPAGGRRNAKRAPHSQEPAPPPPKKRKKREEKCPQCACLCNPAHGAGHGKQHGVHLHGDAQRAQHDARVKVDVGVQRATGFGVWGEWGAVGMQGGGCGDSRACQIGPGRLATTTWGTGSPTTAACVPLHSPAGRHIALFSTQRPTHPANTPPSAPQTARRAPPSKAPLWACPVRADRVRVVDHRPALSAGSHTHTGGGGFLTA